MAQLINEAKRMQKLAGIITESQLNEVEEASVDKALDNSKVQAASEKLAQDPALLQKAIGELSKLGIDKNTLVKAAQAHTAGKSVDGIIDSSKIEKASSALTELETPEDISKSGKIGGAKIGGALGAILGLGMVGIVSTAAFPAALLAGIVVGAIGALKGASVGKKDAESSEEYEAATLVKQMGKEKALQYVKSQTPTLDNRYNRRGEDMMGYWNRIYNIINNS